MRRLPFLGVVLVLAILGALLASGAIEVPPGLARRIHTSFNHLEAAIWGLAGVYVLWRTRRGPGRSRRHALVAACAFVAFGISDLVEVRTGAWFRPWWLLAWKAACVVVLVTCLILHRARPRRKPPG